MTEGRFPIRLFFDYILYVANQEKVIPLTDSHLDII